MESQGTTPDDLLTVEELAAAFGLSEGGVWKILGRFPDAPRYRLPGKGKRTFIKRGDFAAMLATPIRVAPERRPEKGKAAA